MSLITSTLGGSALFYLLSVCAEVLQEESFNDVLIENKLALQLLFCCECFHKFYQMPVI